MADRWADFRFLQDGQTPLWCILEDHKWWVLHLKDASGSLIAAGSISKQARIDIMPSTHDTGLAIDAALEFLDRLWERRMPKFIDCPDALMSLCVKAAIRQE